MTKFISTGEIVIYQADNQPDFQLEVIINDDTVWLTQAQMAELFNATKQNISLHINNVFKEQELKPEATVKEYLTVQTEGNSHVKHDLEKHNAQYEPIEIFEFKKSHDRFIIIDRQKIYHIGASLKDLGKKWFAFSHININPEDILKRLEN